MTRTLASPNLGKLLAGLVVLLLALAGCGSPPRAQATHKPSPVATPCPVEAASGVWVRGCVALKGGDNVDLDGGQVDVQTYDLAFASGILSVAPGTEAAYLGTRDFDSLTPTDIAGASLGTGSYDVSQLQKGGILAVQTGHGRPSKVRVDKVSANELDLSFFTYSSFAVTAPTSTPSPSHHQPTPTPSHSSSPSSHPSTSPST